MRKEDVDVALRNLEADVADAAAECSDARREAEELRRETARYDGECDALARALAGTRAEFERKELLLARTARVGQVVERQLMELEDARSKGVERAALERARTDLAERWRKVRAARERLSGAIVVDSSPSAATEGGYDFDDVSDLCAYKYSQSFTYN
jgi:chromosome segregation ATPase